MTNTGPSSPEIELHAIAAAQRPDIERAQTSAAKKDVAPFLVVFDEDFDSDNPK